MPRHPQTRITLDGEGVDVDAGMAPLIRALWASGIRTVASWQSWSEMQGAAYVGFVTVEDVAAFKAIVSEVSTVTVRAVPDEDLIAMLRDEPGFRDEAAAKSGAWAIGFPPEDIPVVLRAVRRAAAA